MRRPLLPMLGLPLLTGCQVTVYELAGPFDIVEQSVGTTSVEGAGFIDLGEEDRAYAFGHRWQPADEAFVTLLDPPVQTEASVSSLDLDEEPVVTLTYGGSEVTFSAAAAEAEDQDVVLTAADPWGTGEDLVITLAR